MILRRWVTEMPPSLRHNLDQLTCAVAWTRTRKRPPYYGFVQVLLWEVCRPDLVTRVTRRLRKPLGRIVGVPSLWQRPGGVLQQHGLGVSRPGGLLPSN